MGVGYNIDPMFRVNLDARYYGTTNPQLGNVSYTNNNLSAMLSLQVKFGAPPAVAPPPPAPPVAAPSFMVFFDWDRSNLSQQALNTIRQAAGAYKTKGNARITATGHTDTSGPEAYNMALSLRRANTVKDALVREGVPATAIAVIGRGESQLLVQTGDGVREPQNRRVEIVIQLSHEDTITREKAAAKAAFSASGACTQVVSISARSKRRTRIPDGQEHDGRAVLGQHASGSSHASPARE